MKTRRLQPEMNEREIARRKKKWVHIPSVFYAVALLVVLVLLCALGNPNFISLYNLGSIITFAATLFVVAVGQMCTILVGGIDLSVGGIMSLVSVLFVVILNSVGMWAYPICILLGITVGYINGNILTRVKIPSFLATLGTGGILSSLALVVSPNPIVVPEPFIPLLNIVNGSLGPISNFLLLTFLVFVLYYGVLRFTKTGRNVYYVGSNIKMSLMSGIDITKTRNFAFTLSGLAASLAAILLSCENYGGAPFLGGVYVLNSIAAVVVGGTALTGGTGGAVNAVIGALILGVVQNGMNVLGINAYFRQTILGVMVILSVALTFERSKYPVIK